MTLFGPDVSKWQQGMEPEQLGFSFAIARASIGRTVDPFIGAVLDYVRAARFPFCAYHFPYPTGSYPAHEQAATFAQAVGGDTSIPCMIDWESDGDRAATVGDVLAIVDEITTLGYHVTLLYTGDWYWQSQGSPDLRPLVEHDVGLIVADYGSNPTGEAADVYRSRGGDNGRGWEPLGGVTPTFWQFGSQVHIGRRDGAPLRGDCNAFRGDVSDLARWFQTWSTTPGPTPQPTPTPTPQEDSDMLFIGRLDTNPNLVLIGNGVIAQRVRSSSVATIEAQFDAGYSKWHHPHRADFPLVPSWDEIATFNEGQMRVLVGVEVDESEPE